MNWLKTLAQKTNICINNGHATLDQASIVNKVKRLADWLKAQKVQTIALNLDNSPEWVLFDLAAAQAQVICVPIPHFFTTKQIKYILSGAQVDMLISHKGVQKTPLAGVYHQRFAQSQLTNDVLPQGTEKVTFTSGSTGSPKGVCLTTEQQLTTAKAIINAVRQPSPHHLCLLPLSTLLENVAGIYSPLLHDGTVTLLPMRALGFEGSRLNRPEAMLQAISVHKPNSLILVPELLSVLVQACQKGWQAPKSLSFIAVGGAKVSPRLLQQAQLMGLPVYQGYGLSECASVVSLTPVEAAECDSIGKPLAHVEAQFDQGQLIVKGNCFLGYINQPNSWYPQEVRTGDLVHQDNQGYLYFNGRSKNQLTSSFGRNINPEWPEAELLADGVIQQAVVLGDDQPHCIALLLASQTISNQQLKHWLNRINRSLPDYAQIKQVLLLGQPMTSQLGLYTNNHRPQRQAIATFFQTEIEQLYAQAPDTIKHSQILGQKTMEFYDILQTETEQERQHLLSAPIINRCFSSDIELDDYVGFLKQAYHHVKHTTPLLMTVGSLLPESKEWLRNAVAEYIEEELGHQEWILNDIAACGYDKEVARHSSPSFATEIMVAYTYDSIRRINPLCFFGLVQVLEGTSVALADQAAHLIENTLNLPKSAFSYLISHGFLDQEHIQFFVNLMNRITDPEEQAVIIHSAKRFYQLYSKLLRTLDKQHQIPLAKQETVQVA